MQNNMCQAASDTINDLEGVDLEVRMELPQYNPKMILMRIVEARRLLDEAMNDADLYYDEFNILTPIDSELLQKLVSYIAAAAQNTNRPEWQVEELLLQSLRRNRLTDIIRGEFVEARDFLGRLSIRA